MEQQLPELPHLVVDEPKRSKKVIAAIAVFSLMIISIPLGIFLVSQRTGVLPQAAQNTPAPQLSKSSIELKSGTQNPSLGSEVTVDVIIRSELDSINLVSSQIKYDPNALKLDKIATSSAETTSTGVFFANKWLESSSAEDGEASLIAGVPAPGVKTTPDQSLTLATLHFTPIRLGQTTISFNEDSALFRNSDNQNTLKDKTSLTFEIARGLNSPISSPSASPRGSSNGKPSPSPAQPLLSITNPVGGEAFSYLKPISIAWASKDINRIKSIGLYINDEYFGSIATDLVNENKFDWIPAQTLLLPYISIQNTFQLEVVGRTRAGSEVAAKTDGPFGIIAKEEVPEASQGANIADLVLGISDASLLLSQFNTQIPSKVDLNLDGQINQIDFWLLRKLLLQRGIIKDSSP